MNRILKNKKKDILEKYKSLVLIAFALIAAFSVSTLIFGLDHVVGESMNPKLQENDWVIVDKRIYKIETPKIGDIIVFKNKKVSNQLMIKRIVGIPGSTIKIENQMLYIDGKEICTISEKMALSKRTFPKFIPENCYFVVGDNINNSIDSRFWTDPFITKEDINGKVTWKVFPEIEKIDK